MKPADPLRVPLWELWALAALLCFYLLASLADGDLTSETVNLVGPLWLAATLLFSASVALRRASTALWTGLFWMRVSTAIYFGLGSVATRAMNQESVDAVYSFFEATPAQLGKLNLIVALSSFFVLLAVRVAALVWPWRAPEPRTGNGQGGDGGALLLSGLVFAAIGYPIKYLLVLPLSMGAFGDMVLPGMIGQLVWLAAIALFLLTFWAARHAPNMLFWLALIAALDCFMGVLRFSKTDALLPLMMFALGWLQQRASWLRLMTAALCLVFAFHLIQPLSGYGRSQLSDRFGTIQAAGFGERLAILGDYLRNGPDERSAGLQSSLMRIAYNVSAAPAIAAYDAGEPGNSLSAVPSVFVPRLFWPDKPSFDMGRDYTIMVIGLETSSTWMGYYAESYWNWGWSGIPVVMLPFGFLLFAGGRYAAWVVHEERWLHFPAVFLGMWMGVRTDGVIATDIVAGAWLMLLYFPVALIGSAALEGLMGSRRKAPKVVIPS